MNAPQDTIIVEDLELWCRIGVTEDERQGPQRLLVRVEMEKNFRSAVSGDDLSRTIDYVAVTRRLVMLSQGRAWKLIETLAVEMAELILREFGAEAVTVEVRKFVLPEARHVAVRVWRCQSQGGGS